ncbi:MAG: hypothetical protein IT373_36350 [Polyangiaceae bacterium]|nr:hypothetical protein [Polyangiaceae bacterium]
MSEDTTDASPATPGDPGAFTALDWIAVVVVALIALALALFPFAIGLPLAEVYADFGVAELPALTAVATGLAAPLALAAVVLASLVGAVALRARLRTRRLMVAAGFAFGVAALVACALAAYAPIFERAGAVRREAD